MGMMMTMISVEILKKVRTRILRVILTVKMTMKRKIRKQTFTMTTLTGKYLNNTKFKTYCQNSITKTL